MSLTKDNFEANATTFHNGKYTYENCIYTTRDVDIIVTCELHGDFHTTPKNHLRGGHCPVCKPPKVSTTIEFIKRSTVIHKGVYEYTTTKFEKSNKPLEVTCRMHGIFKVSPNNHLRGKGCPTCALTKRGWNRSIYTGAPAILYIVEVSNTTFKIGITKKSLKERYYKDVQDGATIDTVMEYHFIEGTDAYDIEKTVLNLTKDSTYKGSPLLTNGGNTELRTQSHQSLIEHLIKELHEINRITIQAVAGES